MSNILAAGPNLKLVPYSVAYADEVFFWYYHPALTNYFRDNFDEQLQPSDLEHLEDFFKTSQQVWLILLEQKTNRAVGLMNASLIDAKENIYRIGIMLEPDSQGLGYCLEGNILLCQWLFLEKQASKVVCEVSAHDVHLNHVIQRGGFVRQGAFKNKNTQNDETVYALFRETFLKVFADYQKTGVWKSH